MEPPADGPASAPGRQAGGAVTSTAAATATALGTAVGSPVVGTALGAVARSRTGRRTVLIVAAVAALVMFTVIGTITSLLMPGGVAAAGAAQADAASSADADASAPLTGSDPCTTTAPSSIKLTAEQKTNATTIIQVGQSMAVPVHGQVIAIATSITEAGLVNHPGGDLDSAGLFQQRPSQGWGTYEQVTDPVHAATEFYTHLLRVPNWQTIPPGEAAQDVQGSAFPDRYATHMDEAEAIVATLGGGTDDSSSCGSSGSGAWVYPLPAGKGVLTSPYGWRKDPVYGTAEFHDGIDLATPTGTPVYVVSDGTVDTTGTDPAMGNYIWVTHTGGVRTRYQHLSKIEVQVGQQVKAGDEIALSGSTGKSTGPHLHISVYVNGSSTDPKAFLESKGVM